MDYKTLSFPQYSGAIYAEEYNKTLDVEIKKPEKMPREAFIGPSHRAKAMAYYAEIRKDRFEALTMLLHGKEMHGETNDQEETELMAVMPDSDIEAAQFYARSWWLD